MLAVEGETFDGEVRLPLEPSVTRTRLALFLLPLVVAPLLVLAAAFLILPSAWFAHRSGNPFLQGVGYGETLHANCQILIYGDSTGEVGLDPRIIAQRTGLTTCNIAEPMSILLATGNSILDRFLASNPPPRVLLFFFSPGNLDPVRSSYGVNGAFEAITYRMRQPDKLANLVPSCTIQQSSSSGAPRASARRFASSSIARPPLESRIRAT